MLKRYSSVFLTPILVVAVLAMFFAMNGFFPFGNSSISWCDMTQQVIPLFCDFKDILSGDEGFFLSLQNAGGMNFFGVFFFFLASPFSFLVMFTQKADIPLLMNVLILFKLAASSVTAAVYFEKRYNNLSLVFKIILSFSYAFCGYGMLFYQNIIWLDIMYLFPLLMLGIHNLIEKQKTALFITVLSLIIIVNFYISYMVILFVILFFGLYSIYCKKIDFTVFVNLGISAVCALFISGVVWIPSLIQYIGSGRTKNVLLGLAQSNFFAYIETSVPLLFATGIIFAVLVCLLPRMHKEISDTKMFSALFFIMCIPIIIEPVNRMWHTGDYMSFPVRYGFITVFLGLIVCAHGFVALETDEKGNKVIKMLAVALSLGVSVFIIWYTNENFETLSRYAQTLWGNTQSFRGLALIFVFAVIAAAVPAVLRRKKLISKNALALCLCLVVLAQSYSSLCVYVKPAEDSLNMKDYTDFVSLEDEINDDGFYRVNMQDKLIDANMTGAIGYNSLGHYTSLTNSDYMKAVRGLGYSGYWMEIGNWGGSIISDALMSVKYEIQKEDSHYYIRQLPDATGFIIPALCVLPEELPQGNRAQTVGDIFADMFSLTENPVTSYGITSAENCEYTYFDNEHRLVCNSSNNRIVYDIWIGENQTLYFDCFNGASNALTEPVNDSFSVYVNNVCVNASYPSQSQNGLLKLGTFENERVTVSLKLKKNVECCSFGVFGIDNKAVTDAAESVQQSGFSQNGSTVTAQIPQNYSGEMFISLPYNSGYKITLDGEPINYKRCLTGFTAINISHGGELKISFVPVGFKVGLVASVLGLAGFALILLKGKKIEHLPVNAKKAVFLLFIAVFTVFVLAVFILPVIINLIV